MLCLAEQRKVFPEPRVRSVVWQAPQPVAQPPPSLCLSLHSACAYHGLSLCSVSVQPPILHAGQLCDALGFMHARGLAHRDVRPENILLTSKDLCKCKAGPHADPGTCTAHSRPAALHGPIAMP